MVVFGARVSRRQDFDTIYINSWNFMTNQLIQKSIHVIMEFNLVKQRMSKSLLRMDQSINRCFLRVDYCCFVFLTRSCTVLLFTFHF